MPRKGETACPVCGCPPQLWLRTGRVATALDCGPRAVIEMIERGAITGRKVGGRWLIRHTSVDALLAESKSA